MGIVRRMKTPSSFDFSEIQHDPDWAQREFGSIDLGDPRRTRRLVDFMKSTTLKPGASVPDIASSWGEAKGFYRLLAAPEVTAEALFEEHRKGTLRRAGDAPPQVLLAVQDTTTTNYSTRGKLAGQGQIGSRSSGATGLHLHNTLLVGGGAGEIFGLLGAKIYAREGAPRAGQPAGTRDREPIEEKESYRWLESFELARGCHAELCGAAREAGREAPVMVSVGDREADIYELLVEAARHREAGMHLLVRSQHDRQLAPEKEPAEEGQEAGDKAGQERLWEHLAATPERGQVVVEVPRKGGFKKREVTLSIRYAAVELDVPAHKRKYQKMVETVKMNAVLLVEEGGGKQAICWRLVTTLPVESVEEAAEIARWYALRWQVEVLHRVLKTGCRVERRQLRTMDRLRPMIAIDLVVACYLMSMVSAARGRPEVAASGWLEEDEIDALHAYQKVAKPEGAVVTIGQAVRMIGKLGGHLGRKSDGPPGAEVVWRGLKSLEVITETWRVLTGAKTCG